MVLISALYFNTFTALYIYHIYCAYIYTLHTYIYGTNIISIIKSYEMHSCFTCMMYYRYMKYIELGDLSPVLLLSLNSCSILYRLLKFYLNFSFCISKLYYGLAWQLNKTNSALKLPPLFTRPLITNGV